MRKRIIPLLLLLVLLLSMAQPSMANNRNGVYILDEKEYLTQSEVNDFQSQAQELSERMKIDVLFVLTYDLDLEQSARSLNLGNREDQIMLIANDQSCDLILFGRAQSLTYEDTVQLVDAYTLEPTYVEGITAYLAAAEQILETGIRTNKLDSSAEEYGGEMPRLVDRANLLNSAEQRILLQRLNEISERQQLDVVVVTVYGLDGKTPTEYADDFFDYNGYGFGENYDGILLLVSMEQRDWWISTTGYGITAFTDAGLEYISDCVVSKLSSAKYSEAFEIFAVKCDEFITQARTGEPYDVGNMPQEPFRWGLCLFISIAVGLFAAGCVVWFLKGQLITVHAKSEANQYSCAAAPKLTVNKENYLYSTMSSRPKMKQEDFQMGRSSGGRSFGGGSTSGGSTIHRSSSGRFHGGRGGKF